MTSEVTGPVAKTMVPYKSEISGKTLGNIDQRRAKVAQEAQGELVTLIHGSFSNTKHDE